MCASIFLAGVCFALTPWAGFRSWFVSLSATVTVPKSGLRRTALGQCAAVLLLSLSVPLLCSVLSTPNSMQKFVPMWGGLWEARPWRSGTIHGYNGCFWERTFGYFLVSFISVPSTVKWCGENDASFFILALPSSRTLHNERTCITITHSQVSNTATALHCFTAGFHSVENLVCSQVCVLSETGNLYVTRKSLKTTREGTWAFTIHQSFSWAAMPLHEETPLQKGAMCPSFYRRETEAWDII